MPLIELIYDTDCPNVHGARAALLQGFGEAGLQPSWTEWNRKSPDSPAYVQQYGSPTILVDGRDVAGIEPGASSESCRIYDHQGGSLERTPPVHAIASALENASTLEPPGATGRRRDRWQFLASAPGVGAVLLPVGVCPACWPAYAGILGSLGLGFLLDSAYLLPITLGLLGVALFALAFRAKTRRGYRPLALGVASVCLVLIFKFAYALDPLVYAGVAGLVAASAWNAWPKAKGEIGSCSQCVQQGAGD